VIKRQFGYVKVRYRGIVKNAAQVLTLFALSNPVDGTPAFAADDGISAPVRRGNPPNIGLCTGEIRRETDAREGLNNSPTFGENRSSLQGKI
jgi:hypothetical protein